MNRDFLRDLGVEEDAIEKIMKEHGKTVNDYKKDAAKVDGLESQIDDLTAQIQDRDSQLEELKKVDADALQKTIDNLQEANKNKDTEYQDKLEKQAKDFAIESALRDAKAKNPKAAKALLDVDSITLKDGKLIGIDEQLTPLKESESYLFGEDEPAGLKGRKPNEGGTDTQGIRNPWSKETFNLTEQAKILKENPELAKQLQSNK